MKFLHTAGLLFLLIWTFFFIMASQALIYAGTITLDAIVVTAAKNDADEKKNRS